MNKTVRGPLGARVKELREAADLSQTQLARMVGTEQTVISRIEARDGYEPGVFLFGRIAQALGVTVDGLLEGLIEMPAQPQDDVVRMLGRIGDQMAAFAKGQALLTEKVGGIEKRSAAIEKEVENLKRSARPKARA